MNERIKELAEQAGFYGDPVFHNLETFAQLIVKQSLNKVVKIVDAGGDIAFAVWQIKQDFGVNND